MSFAIGVLLIAVVTSLCCALPGTLLVLRGQSMLVDAISHAVLPGIAIGFLLTGNLSSPLLVAGAALAGVVVTAGSEWLRASGRVAEGTPVALVFPALFSVGVIIITANFSGVHLDVDAVLVGDLNLAAWQHLYLSFGSAGPTLLLAPPGLTAGSVSAGFSLGPAFLYALLGVLALNALVLYVLRRPLTAAIFDEQFARVAGVRTSLLWAALTLITAFSTTAAFQAAGAVLTVALTVAPGATAALFARRPATVMWLALAFAAFGAVVGFSLAYLLDAPTSAGMAVCYGLLFCGAALFSAARRRARAGAAPSAS